MPDTDTLAPPKLRLIPKPQTGKLRLIPKATAKAPVPENAARTLTPPVSIPIPANPSLTDVETPAVETLAGLPADWADKDIGEEGQQARDAARAETFQKGIAKTYPKPPVAPANAKPYTDAARDVFGKGPGASFRANYLRTPSAKLAVSLMAPMLPEEKRKALQQQIDYAPYFQEEGAVEKLTAPAGQFLTPATGATILAAPMAEIVASAAGLEHGSMAAKAVHGAITGGVYGGTEEASRAATDKTPVSDIPLHALRTGAEFAFLNALGGDPKTPLQKIVTEPAKLSTGLAVIQQVEEGKEPTIQDTAKLAASNMLLFGTLGTADVMRKGFKDIFYTRTALPNVARTWDSDKMRSAIEVFKQYGMQDEANVVQDVLDRRVGEKNVTPQPATGKLRLIPKSEPGQPLATETAASPSTVSPTQTAGPVQEPADLSDEEVDAEIARRKATVGNAQPVEETTAGSIKKVFSGLGSGVKENANAKAEEYARRIINGEDESVVLQGIGPAFRKSVEEARNRIVGNAGPGTEAATSTAGVSPTSAILSPAAEAPAQAQKPVAKFEAMQRGIPGKADEPWYTWEVPGSPGVMTTGDRAGAIAAGYDAPEPTTEEIKAKDEDIARRRAETKAIVEKARQEALKPVSKPSAPLPETKTQPAPMGAPKTGIQTPVPKLVSAAVRTPDGKVVQGPNHPAIDKSLGKPETTREQRNTPDYGFVDDKGQFVTREQATEIAKASGQALEQFEAGHPLHSDEALDTETGKPISETKQPVKPVEPATPVRVKHGNTFYEKRPEGWYRLDGPKKGTFVPKGAIFARTLDKKAAEKSPPPSPTGATTPSPGPAEIADRLEKDTKFRKAHGVHIDLKPGAENRVEKIMRDGLTQGMLSDIQADGKLGWAEMAMSGPRHTKAGDVAYIVPERSERIRKPTKPIAVVRFTRDGQTLFEALRESVGGPAEGKEGIDKPPETAQSTTGVTNEPLEGKGREPRSEATHPVGATPEDTSSGKPETPVQRPPEKGRPDTVPPRPTTTGETGLRPSSESGERPASGQGASAERPPDQPATTGAGESAGEPGSGGEHLGVSGEPVSPEPVDPAEKAPANAGNFVLTDLDMFETGGDKAKFKDNIAAIRLMKAIMEEQRPASPAEQQILAKYVGWGRSSYSEGLFGYYGETARKWEAEREELEKLLTADELDSARSSTKNAHYTSPKLATAMWEMAKRMGFKGGLVNEPAEGTGVFWGTMPGAISRRSSLVGSEMDTLTSNIAKLLYPGGKHETASYQEAILPSNFFDVQISNYPFGDIVIRQDQYNKVGAVLHDYFFLKGIDTVRPGGLLIAITSTFTMDKGNTRVREILAQKADLVAAMRLPGGAFLKNAGTDVVTDILILRKKIEGDIKAFGAKWTGIKMVKAPGTAEPIPINEYFADHPEQILGTLDRKNKLYGGGQPHVSATPDFMERLQKAIERLPADAYEPKRSKPPVPRQIIEADSKLKDYGYQVKDGKLWQRQGNEMVPREMTKEKLAQVGKILSVRDDVRKIIGQELAGVDDQHLKPLRDVLNRHYDEYVKKYGNLHSRAHKGLVSDDPDWPILVALENYNPETKAATKADIFSRRTVKSISRPGKAENIKQAVGISMNETGSVEPERIAQLTASTPEKVIDDLVNAGLAFRVPGGGLELGDYYLSGNVRAKLIQAEAAAKIDNKFERNVEALKKVIPEDKPHSEIDVRLGSPWVANTDYQGFFAHLLKSQPNDMSVNYLQKTGKWILELRNKYLQNRAEWNEVYGTHEAGFQQIVQAAMDDKPIMLYRTVKTAEGEKRELMADETAAANLKVEEVRELFKEWIWTDDGRRERLHRFYNDNYNNIVDTEHDGSWLEFPTMDAAVIPYPHQKNAVARTAHTRKVLLGHEVGTGKSLIYGMTAAKMKELGFANKPALAVLKANIEQVTEEIQRAFPTMRILTTNENFDADSRKKTIARMATGDWDLVILTHDNLNMMDVDKDVEQQFIQEEIAELDDVIRASEASEGRGKKNKTTKQLEKLKERLEEKLKEALDKPRDPAVSFQKSGIDMLMIDEAHVYKSLPVYTSRGSVKGIPQSRSDRATNLLMNTRWLNKNNPKAVMVFGTGTPIDNSMVELYNWQKYLQMDELVSRGIESFDGWANTFGQTVTSVEPTAAGEFKPTTRFKRFTNLQELSSIARLMLDTRFIEDMPNIKRPKKIESVVKAEMNREQAAYMASLAQRAKDLKGKKVVKGGDNMLLICTDGRKAAMHMGLVTPNYYDNPDIEPGKVDMAIAAVIANHKADPTVTQMIFSDLGVNPTDWGFSLYKHIIDGLVKGGIPKDKIIDFTKLKEGDDRLAAIAKLRNGDALVGIGSTATMGTGVNAQRHLKLGHNIDAPMTPGRMRQRDGRLWRQGNLHEQVSITRYVTEGSLDAFIWSLINNKDAFIQQFLKYGAKVREIEELDSEELSPARVMAEASGNPDVLNAIELQEQIKKLEQKRRIFQTAQARAQSQADYEKRTIDTLQRTLPALQSDATAANTVTEAEEKQYIVGKKAFTEQKAPLNKAIETAVDDALFEQDTPTVKPIVKIGPFQVMAHVMGRMVRSYTLQGEHTYEMGVGQQEGQEKDALSIVRSALGVIRSISSGRYVERYQEQVKQAQANLETLQKQGHKKYEADEELTKAKRELSTVMARLSKSSKEGGSTDTDVKVSAAEKKLEDLTGPNRVNQLKELSDKLTWSPETYLGQLQKEIEAIEGKQHETDERPDAEVKSAPPAEQAPEPLLLDVPEEGATGTVRMQAIRKELTALEEQVADLGENGDPTQRDTGDKITALEDRQKLLKKEYASLEQSAFKEQQEGRGLKFPAQLGGGADIPPVQPPQAPPAAPEPEFTPEKSPTSVKNAIVDKERAKRGLPPAMQAAKRSFGQVWDAAMAEVDANPDVQTALMDELRAKPRALTDREDALLLHQQVVWQNAMDKAAQDLIDARYAGDDAKAVEAKVRAAEYSDKLLDLYNIEKQSGTETGRGLNARKMLVKEDFSLAKMITEKRAANDGKELTDAQTAEIQKLHDKIAEMQKKYDEYVTQSEERIKRLILQKLIDKAKKPKGKRTSPKDDHDKAIAGIKKGLTDNRPITDMTGWIQKLARSFVEDGITEREALVDAVHEVLVSIAPEITRRETMDAISGYGAFKQLSKDQISVQLRDLKGQMQQIAKLEDMAQGEAPKKTGVERRTPSAAEKELIRMVNKEKAAGGYNITDPETQLRSALQALKTRLNTRIADLADKLANEDYTTEPRRHIILDQEATRLKAENERLKQQFRQGLARDRSLQRNRIEQAEDTFVKWRRAFILSGPRTIAKLTSAAAERILISPTEEIAGSLIGKAIPGIASRATRQGGLNAKAEGKALSQGFTKGMRDSWQVLRTGKSDLDVLYGKQGLLPPTAIDFMGHLHGALKTVAKRNEFERSFEKRITAGIANGADVLDPLVQTKFALEAYKDANRSIFMQDNRVVDAYKRALAALEQKNKATGKPPLWSKSAATGAKVMLPIVKVPTNIVAETMEYAVGTLTGSARAARAYAKGVENLDPEEADLIMRLLKKGLIGLGVLLLGFLNANLIGGYYQPGKKRKPGDVGFGAVKVGNTQIPSYLIHNPLLEMLQLGATIRRVADSRMKIKDKDTQGIPAGVAAGALGVFEEVPFVRETADVSKLLDPLQRSKAVGEIGTSLVVPQVVQSIAQATDKTPQGDVVGRKPHGIGDYLKLGVPGLRQTVPMPTKEEVKRLDVGAALRVYQESPPSQRQTLRAEIVKKINSSRTMKLGEKTQWLQFLHALDGKSDQPTDADIARKYAN